MKTGIYCPYCAAELMDPEADRCTSCGMFVVPELRAAIAARVPIAAQVSPILEYSKAASPGAPDVLAPAVAIDSQIIPTAMAVQDPAPELGRRWHESSFTESQQSQVVWQTILFQSSLGLAMWGWVIVPLGRLGQMPYAWIPAVLAVIAGLLGSTENNRWWSLGIILSALVTVVVAAIYS